MKPPRGPRFGSEPHGDDSAVQLTDDASFTQPNQACILSLSPLRQLRLLALSDRPATISSHRRVVSQQRVDNISYLRRGCDDLRRASRLGFMREELEFVVVVVVPVPTSLDGLLALPTWVLAYPLDSRGRPSLQRRMHGQLLVPTNKWYRRVAHWPDPNGTFSPAGRAPPRPRRHTFETPIHPAPSSFAPSLSVSRLCSSSTK